MENPEFSGLGQLNQVLLALNIDGLEPVWTLKQTKQKIFLDIIWFKTPAISDSSKLKKHTPETSDQRAPSPDSSPYVSQDAHAKPASTQTSAGASVNISAKTKRKRKSPSTKKRDRERLEKWKARKKDCNLEPTTCPSHSSSPISSSVTVNLLPHPQISPEQLPHQVHVVTPGTSETDSEKDQQPTREPVSTQDLDITDHELESTELEREAVGEYMDLERPLNMCYNLLLFSTSINCAWRSKEMCTVFCGHVL